MRTNSLLKSRLFVVLNRRQRLAKVHLDFSGVLLQSFSGEKRVGVIGGIVFAASSIKPFLDRRVSRAEGLTTQKVGPPLDVLLIKSVIVKDNSRSFSVFIDPWDH